jgi:electron transfer flavoprotein alpha subunit
MNILVFVEHRDGTIKKASLEAVRTAADTAGKLGGTCTALLVGHGIGSLTSGLAPYGATRVVTVDQADLASFSSTAVAAAIATAALEGKSAAVFLAATATGKDIAPRVAVKLGAGLAADCVALTVENGEIVTTRPVYAGKAMIDVRVKTPVRVYTLRPNVFSATTAAGEATVENLSVPLTDKDFGSVVRHVTASSGRPDVTEAETIVSGGRGLKAPEHFHLVEELADVLGGAVGASRAVVDAGWRPHDEQVGQTGKTVSPTLYVACGISGAVQHLAGMSSSKYIVAINKDKDAPIFQVADYGIVGDALEILPELTAQLRRALGR